MSGPDRLSLPPDAIPPADRIERMAAAEAVVRRVLSEVDPMVSVSPLGAGWSEDLDVYVLEPARAERLARDAGWISLSGILARLGHQDDGSFAVVDSGNILARVDLKTGQARSPLAKAVGRVERRGHADPRAVLEFRHLLDEGVDLSDVDPAFLSSVADLEAALGGTRLARWRSAQVPAPSRAQENSRPKLRRPQIRLGITGIDGSGKSTLIAALGETFERLGLPSEVVWTRPGMGLKRLDTLARRLRREKSTGLRQLAEGKQAETITSRRGLVGWVWLLLVTVAFLADARRKTRDAQGVVIYDRHLLDALGTVDVMYQGVDSSLHARLIRWFLPRADFTVWLDVDPEVAAARKPDDLIGAGLVREQHAAYHRFARHVPRLDRQPEIREPYGLATDMIRQLDERLLEDGPTVRGRLFMAVRRLRH